jgi:hypothetical protein
LAARVQDDGVRGCVAEFKTECGVALIGRTPEESESAMKRMIATNEVASERIGEVLRQLDRAD